MEIAISLDTDQSVTNLESKTHKGLVEQDSTKFTKLKRVCFLGAAPFVFSALIGSTAYAQTSQPKALTFDMVRSAGVVNAGCLPNGSAKVRIKSKGSVEIMDVLVKGLPPNTNFDFFVIQVPNGLFGLSWYQGDIETNAYGVGYQRFIGRFNEETFIVAPGSAPAPVVHNSLPFPDATTNPPTPPVHTFHLGLWFNSPEDASKAGCPNTVTPFNGEHNAGIQVLNTSNFPDGEGPLLQVKPLP
jgi:hypothetical protein